MVAISNLNLSRRAADALRALLTTEATVKGFDGR
jgi:hypothetical protein